MEGEVNRSICGRCVVVMHAILGFFGQQSRGCGYWAVICGGQEVPLYSDRLGRLFPVQFTHVWNPRRAFVARRVWGAHQGK